MRLLHQRNDHERAGLLAQNKKPPRPKSLGARRQSLPLRHSRAVPLRAVMAACDSEADMNAPSMTSHFSRRARPQGGALTVGFALAGAPSLSRQARRVTPHGCSTPSRSMPSLP